MENVNGSYIVLGIEVTNVTTEAHEVLNKQICGWEQVLSHYFFSFTDEVVWESFFRFLELEKSLLSSPPTWPPRSKLRRNISKVENQSHVFLCISLAFKNKELQKGGSQLLQVANYFMAPPWSCSTTLSSLPDIAQHLPDWPL